VEGNRASVEPAEIEAILESQGRDRAHIVAVLSAIQARYNYLPEDALRLVAEKSRITPADLEGVSSFYPRFRRAPSGLHRIRVCVGTACHVKGGETIHDAFRQELEIPEGADTDPGGLFTLEKAACLGCCMLAPVVQIDDEADRKSVV
jgi:NADH-quinone oxidoreductase subunit F